MIKEHAKKEDAEIYWGDETGMRSDCQHGRRYAPKGKTPTIKLSSKRTSTNMISGITNQGKVRFQIYDGRMNVGQLIEFLKRLIKDTQRKVILILDNLRVHHAKLVKAWLAKHSGKIEEFYLSAYSPELNSDEHFNCDLKAGVHSKRPAGNKKQLKAKVLSHMRMLQKQPKRVMKYFRHPKISYAAYPIYLGAGLIKRLGYRQKWDQGFLNYLSKLEAKKPVIACGDFNVAHQEIDLARPKQNYNKSAGYMQEEIDGFQSLISAGLIDTYRHLKPEAVKYSW